MYYICITKCQKRLMIHSSDVMYWIDIADRQSIIKNRGH